jgi:hypothetical protein
MPQSAGTGVRHLDLLTSGGALLVAGLYGAALYLPAYYEALDDRILQGWETLLLGLIALYEISRSLPARIDEFGMWWAVGVLLAGILPNLLLGVGWIFLLSGRRRAPWVAGCLALLVAVLWVSLTSIEEGKFPPVFVGFGFWLASMACLVAVGAGTEYRTSRSRPAATHS